MSVVVEIIEETIGDVTINKEIKKKSRKSARKYFCDQLNCMKSFDRPWKLKNHALSHTGQRPHKCKYKNCSKTYQNISHLKRHYNTFHVKEEDKLKCPLPDCEKTFGCATSLKSHVERHSTNEKFKCALCKQTFKWEEQLIAHEDRHRGILPFPCPDCNSQFKRESLLVRHMKSHLLRKCEYEDCNFLAETFPLLRAHVAQEHSTSFDCAFCEKSFRDKAFLRDHVFRHIPYDKRDIVYCTYEGCTRAYYHDRNLKYHIKNYHEIQRYYCPVTGCTKSFSNVKRLEGHQRKNHKNHKKLLETLAASGVKESEAVNGDVTEPASSDREMQDEVKPGSSERGTQVKVEPGSSTKEVQSLGQYSMVIIRKDHI